MNRRELFRLAAAPIGAAVLPPALGELVTATSSPAPACEPLVDASEILMLSLDRDVFLGTRCDGHRWLSMTGHEWGCFPVSLTLSGEHGWSRGDLCAELRRLTAILEGGAPICDDVTDTTVQLDLVPGTARVRHIWLFDDGGDDD